MKIKLFSASLLGVLAGCSPQSEENAEAEKRIATCQEVMKVYMTQVTVYERDRKRLVGSCQIAQRHRSLEQWQCTLSSMQKGEKYKDASDKCGVKNSSAP